MRLYIPEIGDRFELTADWHFNLHKEHRNTSLWDLLGCDLKPERALAEMELEKIRQEIRIVNDQNYRRRTLEGQTRYHELLDLMHEKSEYSVPVVLPAGSCLKLDRVYIRKGASDFSSLSFFLTSHPDYQFKKSPRFWAKLADCNQIEFTLMGGY